MKKLIKSVAVLLAAALAVGSFVSCKNNVDSGDDFGQVSGGKGKSVAKTVVFDLTAEPEAVSWYRWTTGGKDARGPIVDAGISVYEAAGTEDDVTLGKKLNLYTDSLKGKKYVFKFDTPGDYNFYYYQKPNEASQNLNHKKDADPAKNYFEKDRVGYVKVTDGSVRIFLDDSDWKYVNQQGAFYIKQNEPAPAEDGRNASFFGKGDYTITEVWPLEARKNENGNVINGEYVVTESLKYKDLTLSKDKTQGFLFPATKAGETLLITTRQPNRADGAVATKQTVYYTQDDKGNVTKVSGKTFEGASSREITQKDADWKNAEYWGYNATIIAHKDAAAVKSSHMDNVCLRKDAKKEEFKKNALDPVTYLKAVPAVAGDK